MLPGWLLLCWCSIMLGGKAADPSQKVLDISDQEPLSPGSQLQSNPTSRVQCQDLRERFPHLVSFPGESVYEDQQSHYWSITQAVSRPACRLTPSNADETSQLIQYLSKHEIDIAIVSGGHSTTVGATNLHSGITLDLSALSTISIADDKSSVKFGPGARWLDIYKALDPHGLTVTGGRAGSVGAGGFLLGGGISILAPNKGWSCDNLIAIEVVLGNGTTITADATKHSDLFTSMKGIGTNFGIATSFTMPLVPFSQLQSSVLQYQGEQFKDLANELTTFVENSHLDPDAAMDLSIIADQSRSYIVGYLMATRFGNIKDSQTLKPFYDVPHAHGYINNVRPQDIASSVDISNPRGFRHSRCTVTIKNDKTTLLAIFAAIENEFLRNDLPGGISYMPAMLVQPIYRTQLGGKNVLGLDEDTEPLLLLSLEATWSLPQFDTLIPEHLTTLRLLITEFARRHGSNHAFIYPNYAAGDQDIFQAIREQKGGEGKMEVLREVQGRYDSGGYMRRRVAYPFKLG